MKLIVGLGNPGEHYQSSRHNVGFMTVDFLAGQQDISLQKHGFEAIYGTGRIGNEPVLLAKPQTYMNLSGAAVAKLLAYFKVDAEDLIVIHDDMDLPFATIRLKRGGGSGGHKGLTSIIDYWGSYEFLRVRIGIGKPVHKFVVEKYVLSPFTEGELTKLPRIIALAGEAVKEIVLRGIQSAMLKFHGKNLNDLETPVKEVISS